MSNPLSGRLGTLMMTGWVAQAPTGQDEAFLLLTTDDAGAPVTMTAIADLLGLRAGAAPSLDAMTGAHVEIGVDGWAALVLFGSERLERPVGGEWVERSVGNGRVVLVIGTAPMPAGMDADTYTARHGANAAIGLVSVHRLSEGTTKSGAPQPPLSPDAFIAMAAGPYRQPGRTYPAALPPELAPWYCYVEGGGHSIVVAVQSLYQPGASPEAFLVPAPVKSVLRGWRLDNGFVVADLRYDADLGLMVDETDSEY